MKILFVNFSKGWGGLEMLSANIFCWLKESGWDISFCVLRGSHLHHYLSNKGHEVEAISTFKYLDPRAILAVRAIIDGRHIDIVHSFKSSDIWFTTLATRVLARQPKIVHHLQLLPKSSRKDPVRRVLYNALDRVIAISAQVEKEAKRHWPVSEQKYRVLLNAIDTSRFQHNEEMRAAFRKRHGVAPDDILLGQVGQVCPIKGQRFVLEACLPALRANKMIHMIIAGAPPPDAVAYEEGLRSFIEEHRLSDQVKLLGFCSDTPTLFSAIDVFCLGSVYEPFGLVVLEAMCSKCVVIASRAGGVPEIIEHQQNGFLYESENQESFSRALEAALALSKTERATLIEAAERRVEEKFTMKVYLPALERLYMEVLQEQ